MLDQNFQSYQKHFTNKTRTDRRKSLFENDFTTPFSKQLLKFDKKIGNHRIRNQITASLLSDISAEAERGWKGKKKERLSSRLPFTWLAGWGRKGNGVGVKASHCKGSVHRRCGTKKRETTRAPCRRSLDFRGRGRLLSVSRSGEEEEGGECWKGKNLSVLSRAGYEIAVCLVKWMEWFRIIGNGCRRVDI